MLIASVYVAEQLVASSCMQDVIVVKLGVPFPRCREGVYGSGTGSLPGGLKWRNSRASSREMDDSAKLDANRYPRELACWLLPNFAPNCSGQTCLHAGVIITTAVRAIVKCFVNTYV